MTNPQDLNITPPEETPKPPVETPKEDPNAKIMETLTSLSEQVTGVVEKVDGIQGKWDEFEQNQTPPADDKKDNPPEFQPKTWDDFPAKAKEVAQEVVTQTLQEREDAANEARRVAEETQTTIAQQIDDKTTELEKAGKLPVIKDPNDKNDPGRMARKELYGLAAKMDTLNLDQVADTLNTMHEQGIFYDYETNKYLRRSSKARQNSPVGSSNQSTGSTQGPDYATIHKAGSLTELARRAGI